MKSILRIASSIMVVTVHMALFAQTGVILRGSDITESSLIEALMPVRPVLGATETADSPREEAEVSITNLPRTRSIRVNRDSPPSKSQVIQVAAKTTPAASLLITFETNSANLTPKARQSLNIVGRALKSDNLTPFSFSIEGHADPRGNEVDNLELSRLRAESVAMYLSEQHQIERTRLKTIGRGQTEVINLTQIDAPENRRVTIRTLVQ